MRVLRASATPEAAEAIALLVAVVVQEVGALAAVLGGLDGIVLTAGIGENDAPTRAEIAEDCCWFGLELDPARNGADLGTRRISGSRSALSAWVVPTDEERMGARHTRHVVAGLATTAA